MANKKLAAHAQIGSISDSDISYIESGGAAFKYEWSQVVSYIETKPVMLFQGSADASAIDEDAATGTSTFNNGDVYRITVAATAPHAFSNISEGLDVGDWVVFNGSDFDKQDGVDAVASVNGALGIVVLDADDIAPTGTRIYFTTAEQTKLGGIAAGATVNSADATLLARANHTGTQLLATISDAGALAALGSVATGNIDDDAVTFPKMTNIGTNIILGRVTAGTGVIEGLSATNVRTIINVQDGATDDQTGAEIKTAYENESDTNAFTDTLKSKLDAITITRDTFVLTADYNGTSDVNLTLSTEPTAKKNVEVFYDGVYQEESTWSFSGTTWTASQFIPAFVDKVEIRVHN